MKYFKKNDFILLLIIILIALSIYISKSFSQRDGLIVNVYLDNSLYGSFPLTQDNCFTLDSGNGNYNIVCIEDEKVYIKEASCPDKLCVRQESICHTGESLCCLPNNVFVIIESDGSNEYDAVTK